MQHLAPRRKRQDAWEISIVETVLYVNLVGILVATQIAIFMTAHCLDVDRMFSKSLVSLLYSNNQQAKSPTVFFTFNSMLIQSLKYYMTPTPLLSHFLQCYCEESFKPVFKIFVSILDFLVWFSFVTKFNIFSSQKLHFWISQTTFSLVCTYNMYLHNESVYDSFIRFLY